VPLTNVPVMIEGAAWGVLKVDSTVPREFDEETTDFLMAASALIGAFLQRHHAHATGTEQMRVQTEAQSREILLHEMQHRVKNNFQLILSSVSLQKHRYNGVEVQEALDHVTNRISAISLAHDQLAPREGGQTVNLSNYIQAICHSLTQQTDDVRIEVETDELELAIERAVLVGLILNEVATNSIKYAFGSEGGAIQVKLTAV
jgi:two-component sensor histidine kinase